MESWSTKLARARSIPLVCFCALTSSGTRFCFVQFAIMNEEMISLCLAHFVTVRRYISLCDRYAGIPAKLIILTDNIHVADKHWQLSCGVYISKSRGADSVFRAGNGREKKRSRLWNSRQQGALIIKGNFKNMVRSQCNFEAYVHICACSANNY